MAEQRLIERQRAEGRPLELAIARFEFKSYYHAINLIATASKKTISNSALLINEKRLKKQPLINDDIQPVLKSNGSLIH